MSIFGNQKPGLFSGSAKTISGSWTGTSVLMGNTTTAHGLSDGDYVYITGSSSSPATGMYEIDYVDADTFRVTKKSDDIGTAGIGGSVYAGLGFPYSKVLYDENSFVIADQLNYRSVINGNRTNTHLGDYGEFKLIDFVWKYASPSSRFNTLYDYYHSNVYFSPQGREALQDSSSALITCYVKELKPFFYKNNRNYDAVLITFETNAYHDVSKLI